MSGYWAMGRVKTAMPPARVMMIDSTEAKIGRLMKKRENTAPSLLLGRFHGFGPAAFQGCRMPGRGEAGPGGEATHLAQAAEGEDVQGEGAQAVHRRRGEQVRRTQPVDGREEHRRQDDPE